MTGTIDTLVMHDDRADWPTQLQADLISDLGDYVAAIASMWAEVERSTEADPDNDIVGWQALFDVDIAR